MNVTMVFELLIFIGIELHSFASDIETVFFPCCFRLSACTSEPFQVILCDTLSRRFKLIFFTFEYAVPLRFLYMQDASFSCKMLLKLIISSLLISGWHPWSRFKYFRSLMLSQQSLCTFVVYT